MTNDFHATDPALAQAHGQVEASLSATTPRPAVNGLIDEPTHTATFAMHDPRSRAAAVIDSVIAQVGEQGRTVAWILETPGHADPLSAAPHLREGLGGRLGIGRGILQVQDACGTLFNAGTEVARPGAAFDRLFDEGDGFRDGRDGSVRDRGRLPRLPRLPRRLSPGPGLRGRRRQRPLRPSPALRPCNPQEPARHGAGKAHRRCRPRDAAPVIRHGSTLSRDRHRPTVSTFASQAGGC